MKYIIKPIIYLFWECVVGLRNLVVLAFIVIWNWEEAAVEEFFNSRIPLLFTHGKTMKYKGFKVVHVIFGYACLRDYVDSRVSYYYVDGSTLRLGKVGDLHWNHCEFSE